MIWAKEETLPRAEIEKIQLEKLKQTVHYIYERVEPYRRKMEDAGVKPEDIQSLDDLKKLPFTYKADFRDNYPMGLFAVDKKGSGPVPRKFRDHRETHRSRIHQEGPGCVAWTMWPASPAWEALRRMMWPRSPLATAHLQEPWGSTEDWRRSGGVCDPHVFR